MKIDKIMLRFGELCTKGKNKKFFIKTLNDNIENALKHFKSLTYEFYYDHTYINLNDEDVEEVMEVIKRVSGIHSASLVRVANKDIEDIKRVALELAKESEGKTFKVNSKRGDKTFPIVSFDIVRMVASNILKNLDLSVDVHNPDIIINIEVRNEAAYIFSKTIKCAGGYPLGTGGKVLMMLSGGIDSPVACYLMMKRGIKIECIHYASPPYTNVAVIEKLKDILKELNIYQSEIRLHIIPFTKIQERIYEVSNESYAITIMRRMMYRIASRFAIKNNIKAIANGESLGQVASQTIESVNVINEVTNIPVIRPLAIFDKLDIIQIAKDINTYEISIRPYEDCCTIFAPRNPKTKPDLNECLKFEEKMDYDNMINTAIENVETIVIKAEE